VAAPRKDIAITKGKCPVATARGNNVPVDLYYEVWGTGSQRICFVMGLSLTSQSWEGQAQFFGEMPDYQVLIFDNRGCGFSDAPYGRYTTSEMALDTIELLIHLGWQKDVHLVGVSLGGMISQEMILAQPKMFISLCLTSTTAGRTPPPLAAALNLSKLLLFNRDPLHKIRSVIDFLYPKEWLDAAPDEDNGFRTNREAQFASFISRAKRTREQPFNGRIAQVAAALGHFVNAERLRAIKDSNVPVLVITGTWDNFVNPVGSFYLKDQLQAEFEVFEGAGHAVISERKHAFNRKLLDFFKKASSI